MSAPRSLGHEPPVYFEIALVESSGPRFAAGRPRLFYWLKAFRLPGGGAHDARACLLVRSSENGDWVEHVRELTADQSELIAHHLKKMGLPGRDLDVEAVLDASENWTSLSFRLRMEGRASALDLDLGSSGFRGPDARDLDALLRSLFALVEWQDEGGARACE